MNKLFVSPIIWFWGAFLFNKFYILTNSHLRYATLDLHNVICLIIDYCWHELLFGDSQQTKQMTHIIDNRIANTFIMIMCICQSLVNCYSKLHFLYCLCFMRFALIVPNLYAHVKAKHLFISNVCRNVFYMPNAIIL